MRGRILAALVALATLASLAPARPAAADSAPIATLGPHLQPMESTTVRLAWEEIHIRVRRDEREPTYFSPGGMADYRILFHFEPEADERLTAGFPLFVVDTERSIFGGFIEDLKVTVNGQEVPTEKKQVRYQDIDTSWAVFPVTFREGEPLEMEITYRMRVDPYGKTPQSDLWIAYVLQTGALWAGPIGRIRATLEMDPPIREEDIRVEGPRGTTPGWSLRDGALHWEWRDVEPDFDLSVSLANVYWLDLPAAIQVLLDQGEPDRTALIRLMRGVNSLYSGDGRAGLWMPVRGGALSGEAADRLMPDLLPLVEAYIAGHPEDWEFRQHYLRLLNGAAWHTEWEGAEFTIRLHNEGFFRRYLEEMLRYRQAGGPEQPHRLASLLKMEGLELEAATQDAVAALLTDEMPGSFSSEERARRWVADRTGPALSASHTEALLTAALGRVRAPKPADESPAEQAADKPAGTGGETAAPEPSAEPGTPAEPATPEAPAEPDTSGADPATAPGTPLAWALAAGAAALLGALTWRRHRRLRRTSAHE